MRNGQLKPGYNLKVATRNRFFLAYSLFPNPTDTRTLIPFMQAHQSLFQASDILSMDAGYGSQPNYEFLEDKFPDLVALVPYYTYYNEQSKTWHADKTQVMNWTYHAEEDYYVDLEGVRFNFTAYRTKTDRYGYKCHIKE